MAFIINDLARRWNAGILPYEIEDDILIDVFATGEVKKAIDEWNNKTNLKLIPRDTEIDYLFFTKSPDSCRTSVGRQGGKQIVYCNLALGAFAMGNVVHEIGHAVGFWHEHQRPDRDSFVSVNSTDVNNYGIKNGNLPTPYDCNSIMHYPPITGAIQPQSGSCAGMGQRLALSSFDIAAANGLELDIANGAKELAADGNSLYFVRKDNGQVWRYNGSSWDAIDAGNNAGKQIAASGGNLYQVHTDGSIWRYNGSSWDNIDIANGAKELAADGNSLYFVRKDNGQVWRYNGSSWDAIDAGNNAGKQIAASGGNLYQVHTGGSIWRYNGSSWDNIDIAPSGTQITASSTRLYAAHTDGKIVGVYSL